jgi:phage shock protein C
MNRRLYRSPDDRVLAGVAGGMAETYDFDPALVRVGWALLILVSGGLFLLLYIVMALVVPLRPMGMAPWAADAPASAGPPGTPDSAPAGPMGSPAPWTYRRQHRSEASGPIVIGLILIIVGAYLLARQFVPAFNWGLIWPFIVIAGGLLLILVAFTRTRPAS